MENKTYISARYIKEKSWPIEMLIKMANEAENDNIAEDVYNLRSAIAESFTAIAKELGIKIDS